MHFENAPGSPAPTLPATESQLDAAGLVSSATSKPEVQIHPEKQSLYVAYRETSSKLYEQAVVTAVQTHAYMDISDAEEDEVLKAFLGLLVAGV